MTRRAFRRTDEYPPGTPQLKLVQEALLLPLAPAVVLIKVYAVTVALNYRDAGIANGGNPWPVVLNGTYSVRGSISSGMTLYHF